ncbi:hypothetical protein QPK87_05065 [Kamptonema cortianum]|nr:hypothetical protein [Geitlerinema splendidum]MDK3155946.1 hypothetical protein [Kamptonema cortianum]
MADEVEVEGEQQDQHVEQVSTVREQIASEGITALAPGVIVVIVGGIMYFYQTTARGIFATLSVIIMVLGLGLIGYGVYKLSRTKRVESFDIDCPFCKHTNHLSSAPKQDFRCVGCDREVPIQDGEILEVFQVRCGYCNHLNYYSEKSTGLICEECDRQIPIATDEESPVKQVFEHFTIHDDNHPYDLVLVNVPKNEEVIAVLQQMLALNRNQVKDMMEELPQTILTGIPKKKAELLAAQIQMHKGQAEIKMSAV